MKATASAAQVGRAQFELSRLEVEGDWVHVEGEWSGVRGRRFMRPALTLLVDGRPTRLLADLADKPWAAEETGPWRATFPYTIEQTDSDEAELCVAPDVTIMLPVPERRPGSRKRPTARVSRAASRRPDVGHTAERPQAPARPATDPSEALARELADLRDAQRRSHHQLARLESDNARLARRLEAMAAELQAVVDEREQAHAARAQADAAREQLAAELETERRERDAIVAERDAALHERDRLTTDREVLRRVRDDALTASKTATSDRAHALSEQGAAVEAQRQALAERDAAIADRDAAVEARQMAAAARDGAIAERNAAVAARDALIVAKDASVAEKQVLSVTIEQLHSELAELRTTHGAAMVIGRVAAEPVATRRHRLIPRGTALTALVVVAILLVWVILLRGGV